MHSGQNPTPTGSSSNTSVKRLCQTTWWGDFYCCSGNKFALHRYLGIPASAENKKLRINNEALVCLAKHLFGKSQRRYIHKYCPNFAQSTGSYCRARLDSRDLHLRTCKMNMTTTKSMKRWNTSSKTSRNRHTSRQHRHRPYQKYPNETPRAISCWLICHFVRQVRMANVELSTSAS